MDLEHLRYQSMPEQRLYAEKGILQRLDLDRNDAELTAKEVKNQQVAINP